MGLLKKENNNCIGCDHCEKEDVDLTFFKAESGQMRVFICKECLIKEFLLINPIQFDKGSNGLSLFWRVNK